MQQQSKMKIQDFRPSDQRFNVTVEHADPIITASSAEGANQQHQQRHHHNPFSFLIPLVFRFLREFRINLKFLSNLSKHLGSSLNNQFRSEEESEQSQDFRMFQRFQRCFRTSRKIISQFVKIRSMQIIRKLNQKKSCFKVSYFRNGTKGIFRDIQQIRSSKLSQKSSSRLVLKVMMPMILFLSVISVKKNVDQSLSQVIGPRPGSELKGRFCAKEFKQVISRDDKYASTPQATTLKLILLMSQIHSWEIAVSDIASAFLNTPVDPSKSPIYVQAPREIQYSEPTVWRLKRQLYGLSDAPKSWQAHFSQIMIKRE